MTDETIDNADENGDEDLATCERCENAVPTDEMDNAVRIDRRSTEMWCNDCRSTDAVTCDCCEEHVHEDYTQTVRTGARRTAMWCQSCIDNSDLVTNSDDGEVATGEYAQEHWHFWNSDEEWHTYADEDEDADELHDYNCNVIREHGWPGVTARDALCFGVELEMETTADRSLVIDMLGGRDGNGSYILKSDGSLDSETGIELVTLPFTLDYHSARFDWAALLKPLARRARSGAGTSACGMHVHVNRLALTPLQVGKALVFLNCQDNARFVSCVAQRISNGFCSRDSEKKIADAKSRSSSRYDLLNISGRETIEFRLFRGNLRPERVLKNIEFCHALLTYCAAASMREIESSAPFRDWLGTRCKTYPHLTRFLREHGYLPARRPIPSQYASASAVAVVDA